MAKNIPELFAKPLNVAESNSRSPLPPPNSDTSMKMPQKTPKPVRKLRVLLRVRVSSISLYLSRSIIVYVRC